MIHFLGKIDIPAHLLDDVKTREPDRVASHVAGASHQINLEQLDPVKYNLENYKHYNNDRCTVQEYCQPWYCDVIPDEFLERHQYNRPMNAIVLRVEPGTFSVPHVDRFRHALREHPDLDIDDIARLWIPLEDSTFGQALFVENSVLTHYRAGSVYWFSNQAFHSAANAGLDTRYTLVVYTTKRRCS